MDDLDVEVEVRVLGDLLLGEVNAGELGRAEEGEVTGLRQDRADREDAVGLAGRRTWSRSRAAAVGVAIRCGAAGAGGQQ